MDITENKNIYSTIAYRDCAPAWKHPCMNNVYVKILKYCKNNPGCDAKALSNVGSMDIWKTLVNYGMIDRSACKPFTFKITSKGEQLLGSAEEWEWLDNIIDIVKKTKCVSMSELIIQLSLNGVADNMAKMSKLLHSKDLDQESTYRLSLLKRNAAFVRNAA